MSVQQSINQVLGTAAAVTSIASQPHVAARKEAKANESKLLRKQEILEGKIDAASKEVKDSFKTIKTANKKNDITASKEALKKATAAHDTQLTNIRKQIEATENAYVEGLEKIDDKPTIDYIKDLRKKESSADKHYKQKYNKIYSELEKALKTKEATDATVVTKNIINEQQKKYMEELRHMDIPESLIMNPEVQKQLK